MTDISRESLDCCVFPDRSSAQTFGQGGIWYVWNGAGRRFPEDVAHVYILMPLTAAQAWPEHAAEMVEPEKNSPVSISWATKHPCTATHPHRWELSGTHDKPTLAPSLNWIGRWHGWLRNGRLESC